MVAPSNLAELAATVDLSGEALAVLSVFGVLAGLAVTIKGICFILEAVRGEGNGICPRGSLGSPDDKETRPRKPRAPKQSSDDKGGLC